MREELAKRLIQIKWPTAGNPVLQSDGSYYSEPVAPMEIDAAQGNSATWGDLADECIRQMEWARHQMMVELADEAGQPIDFTKGHTDAVCPLTLAPPDYKP